MHAPGTVDELQLAGGDQRAGDVAAGVVLLVPPAGEEAGLDVDEVALRILLQLVHLHARTMRVRDNQFSPARPQRTSARNEARGGLVRVRGAAYDGVDNIVHFGEEVLVCAAQSRAGGERGGQLAALCL
eukprot:SAG31_NODE_5643_length_2407_cov_1.866551_4_plen_128_part_01